MQIMLLLNVFIVINILLINHIRVNGFIDYKAIQGYFKEKHINYACVIACFNKREQLLVTKKFIFKRQISVINMNRINLECLKTNHSHIGVVVDGDCPNVNNILVKFGNYKCFDDRHHWLILTSYRTFLNDFDNVTLYINANIQVIYPKENVSHVNNFTVEDVYNPSSNRGGILNHRTLGFYNKMEGYVAREKGCKYWIRRNMTGVTLKTIVVLPVPFEGELIDYLNSESHREVNTFNRFHYNLMSYCQKYYNFSTIIGLGKSWGYKNKNNTFDGLVGALESRSIDYGSSPLFVRSDRARVMEYGRRTWILRAAFIFRNPKSKNSMETFIRPLSVTVWILIICSAALLLFFFKLSYWYERKSTKRRIETSWSYLVVCLTGALCQQGMISTPHLFSGRIVMLFMFLFSLLIYQFYSASLVSHLLMKPSTRIRTVKDILHSNMKVGCEDILYNRDYFLYTNDKPSQELYHQKILGSKNDSNFYKAEDGLASVKKGRYAFHVELATAYPIIKNTFNDKAICELKEVQMYRTQQMHANVQKNSPYKDMFDTCLHRLAEHGILSREILFWHPGKPECLHSSKSSVFAIGLDDFYPALVILAIGMGFSLILLIVEVVFHYKLEEKENNVVLYPFVP